MTIDIITYTDEQYANLTDDQILEVRSAQLKKNALEKKLAEKLNAERHRFIKNGTLLSKNWGKYVDSLKAECQAKIDEIRDGLLFFLRFTIPFNAENVPYPLDHTLSPEERYMVVRDYYIEKYSDASERVKVYEEDKVAMAYLGEMFIVLRAYLRSLI